MKISNRYARSVLVGLAIALASGCTPGTSDSGTPPASSSAGAYTTETAPPTTAPPTTAVPTTPPAPVLTTPQAAAEHLYNAWKAGDKPTALLAASDSAVTTLFATKWKASTYFFGGCTEPTAPSECDYNWSGGVIAMKIDGTATAGFRVIKVSMGSAG